MNKPMLIKMACSAFIENYQHDPILSNVVDDEKSTVIIDPECPTYNKVTLITPDDKVIGYVWFALDKSNGTYFTKKANEKGVVK